MNKTVLEEALTYPGLSKKEVAVYLACLGIKKPTPQTIAKETGIPRPTVYRELESLVTKGLMGKIKENKHYIYVPEDPRSIVERLKLQADSVQNVMAELRDLATIYRNRPTVRFFEGKEGVKQVFQDILHTGDKELLAFSSIRELLVAIPEYFNIFMKSRIRRRIMARIISSKDKEGTELQNTSKTDFRKIKFIPDNLAKKLGIIGGHMFIYRDRVALISFESDQTSVIIENQALANVQRSLFEIAWDSIN